MADRNNSNSRVLSRRDRRGEIDPWKCCVRGMTKRRRGLAWGRYISDGRFEAREEGGSIRDLLLGDTNIYFHLSARVSGGSEGERCTT